MKRHSGKTTDNINIMYPENPRSLVVTDNNKEHSLGSRLSCSRLVSAAMCLQCPLGWEMLIDICIIGRWSQ